MAATATETDARALHQGTTTLLPADATSATETPAIEAVGITKRYTLGRDNYVDALRGASLSVMPGEMVAIMGPSGSGKSTIMHMLGCLDNPDTGEVWLAGTRVDGLRSKRLTRVRREQVGFIFQGYNLVPTLTALDNVALAAEYAGCSRHRAQEMAADMLGKVGLADRLHHLPTELSGGQQQRVAIARALVNRPLVVFGDEPTGNLDSVGSAETISMMRSINRATGTTFVLVTHDPDVAAACDRVISMRDGVVVDEGWEQAGERADGDAAVANAGHGPVRPAVGPRLGGAAPLPVGAAA